MNFGSRPISIATDDGLVVVNCSMEAKNGLACVSYGIAQSDWDGVTNLAVYEFPDQGLVPEVCF